MKSHKELLNQLRKQHSDPATITNIDALEEAVESMQERLFKAQQDVVTHQQKATFLENEREVIEQWKRLYDMQLKEVQRLQTMLNQSQERIMELISKAEPHPPTHQATAENPPHPFSPTPRPSQVHTSSHTPQATRRVDSSTPTNQRTPGTSTGPSPGQKKKTPIAPVPPSNNNNTAGRHISTYEIAYEIKSESPEPIARDELSEPSPRVTAVKATTGKPGKRAMNRDADGNEDAAHGTPLSKRRKVNKVGSTDTTSRSVDEHLTSASGGEGANEDEDLDEDEDEDEDEEMDELAIRSGDDGVRISPLPHKAKRRHGLLPSRPP